MRKKKPNNNAFAQEIAYKCPHEGAVIYNTTPVEQEMVFSDIVYLLVMTQVRPIIAPNYCGWIFNVPEDSSFMCSIPIQGSFQIFNEQPNIRKAVKILKKWYKNRVIKSVKDCPYQDYELSNNLVMPYEYAILIDNPILENFNLMDEVVAEKVYNDIMAVITNSSEEKELAIVV